MINLDGIYSRIANRIIEAMMLHDDLAQAFDFLCLDGYKRMHEYYYYKETANYRALSRYFINHHNKLIIPNKVEYDSVIPEEWYNRNRQDIDESTKRDIIKHFVNIWVAWERETKKLYEQYYKDLIDMDEAASACKIYELLCDADFELTKAERHAITADTLQYDMFWLFSEQEYLDDLYARKICNEMIFAD